MPQERGVRHLRHCDHCVSCSSSSEWVGWRTFSRLAPPGSPSSTGMCKNNDACLITAVSCAVILPIHGIFSLKSRNLAPLFMHNSVQIHTPRHLIISDFSYHRFDRCRGHLSYLRIIILSHGSTLYGPRGYLTELLGIVVSNRNSVNQELMLLLSYHPLSINGL